MEQQESYRNSNLEKNIVTITWRNSMLKIIKPSEIDSVLGTEVGVSDWVTIDQDRIDKFADATMDHQFIHVDPEQATPVFGSTIAHGFLSLSLVAGIPFEQEIGMVLEGTKMGLNYGLDKVRFLSPVPVNSEVRIRMKCIDVTCLLYTSPSPRDKRQSRMPSSA